MFTVYCPGHAATVLIWPSSIDRIVNGSTGIEVRYHCLCGHRGVWTTGRQRPPVGSRRPVSGDRS